jgi:NAD-dependent dihydropyrimidine dehydrogenase PreA subunit/nitroreductase
LAPVLDSDKCVKCGDCVKECPAGVYEQRRQQDVPMVVRESSCVECGHCMMRCPVDAISVAGYSGDNIVAVGSLPESEEVASLLLGRRSIRSFTDQQVDRALLERVVILAASAPSAHNVRSTEFTVMQNAETLGLVEQHTTEGLRKMVKAMRNPFMRPLAKRIMGNQYGASVKLLPFIERLIDAQTAGKHVLLHGAPALIAFHGQPTKMAASVNAQLCVQNALVAISGFGLGGFYSGFVSAMAPRDKRLLELLKVPKGNELFGVVAVGYPKTKLTRYLQRRPPQITWA